MRYRGTRTVKGKKISKKDVQKTWVNQKGETVEQPLDVQIPAWVRPVASMLKPPAPGDKELSKGGYPDHLLIWQALTRGGTGANRMAAEIKPFWAFKDRDMENLVSGEAADPVTGYVHCLDEAETDTGESSPVGNLLLQVSNRNHKSHVFLIYNSLVEDLGPVSLPRSRLWLRY